MQLKSTIIDNFSRRGYMQQTQISKREFHILMNTLLSQTSTLQHWLFDQNLTNEIWKQAQQRVGKEQLQIKVEIIVLTMVDAIQILTNRMIQCQDRIDDLKQKRQSYEYEQNFLLLDPLIKKIDLLKKDIEQFQRDFKMMTQPFIGQNSKGELKRVSIKRKQSSTQPRHEQPAELNTSIFDQVIALHLSKQQKASEQNKAAEPVKLFEQKAQKRVPTTSSKEQKNCAFYLLVFLCVLEVTVCMIKYNFANLMVYLIAFVMLAEDSFLPHLIKVGFGALCVSIVVDAIWLLAYMHSYLHLFVDAGVKKELKPYYQYVWFVTLLQAVIKLLLLYFIKSYEVNFTQEQRDKMLDQQLQVQDYRQLEVIKDAYIPKVRQLTREQLAKTTAPSNLA